MSAATDAATATFHDQVIALLPKLRVQALALTRKRPGAYAPTDGPAGAFA